MGRRPRSWGFVLAAFYGPGQAPASLSEPGFLPGLMGGRLELSGFQSPSRLEDSMTLNFQKGRSHRGRFGAARVCGYNPLRVAVIMTLCSQHLRGTNLILATIPRGQYDSETHFIEEKNQSTKKLNDWPEATAKAEFKPCLLNSRSNPQPKAIMWLRFFEIRTFVSL